MSLLLHFLAKLIFFAVLTVLVLTLLTWLTKNDNKSDKAATPPLGEWPEDKETYMNRVSARRAYSSLRESTKGQERRRA